MEREKLKTKKSMIFFIFFRSSLPSFVRKAAREQRLPAPKPSPSPLSRHRDGRPSQGRGEAARGIACPRRRRRQQRQQRGRWAGDDRRRCDEEGDGGEGFSLREDPGEEGPHEGSEGQGQGILAAGGQSYGGKARDEKEERPRDGG